MPYVNTHRGARISPQKVRPLLDMIRGRHVNDALAMLQGSTRRGAVFVGQALDAAVANADQQEADVSQLYVSEAQADKGPVMVRVQPKDRGRAHPIEKKMSHIRVAVEEGKPRR
jgi:large subunit ribosomal protein L22